MAETKAIGTDPVFFYRDNGLLEEIPLTDIYFDGTAVKTRRNDQPLQKWLEFLAARGDLVPSPSPPIATALTATAQRPGSASNHVTIKVEPSTTNTNLVKITATQIDVHAGLTRDTLEARLGRGNTPGSDDGLLKVKANSANAPNPDGTVAFDAGPPPVWTLAAAGADKISLELRDATGIANVTFAVTVIDLAPGGNGPTFKIRVEAKAVANDVPFGANFPTARLGELAYLVTFTPPTTPAPFLLPRSGTITLNGGADKVEATAAKATLLVKD